MNENIMEFLKKYYLYIGIALFATISLLLTIDLEKDEIVNIPTIYETGNQFETYIYIDIRGSILNPGVYKVETGTRLFQLISLAGGLNSDANELAINQSQLLSDEMFVYVPNIDEIISNNEYTNTNDEIDQETKININIATKTELELLPGIGPATAESIIDYREDIAIYITTEDIMNVPGIGESTYNEIKDLIIT